MRGHSSCSPERRCGHYRPRRLSPAPDPRKPHAVGSCPSSRARHMSCSAVGPLARASSARAPGASYFVPIAGHPGLTRTATRKHTDATTAPTAVHQYHAVSEAVPPPPTAPRAAAASSATSRAPRKARTVATSTPADATAPTAATTWRMRPRVTSTTPQAASATNPSAVASGALSEPVATARTATPAASAEAVAQSLLPATAASVAPASPRPTVGAKLRLAIEHGGWQLPAVEAGALAGVAGGPLLVHLDQQGVAVAVEEDPSDPLAVTRGLSLDPVLLARPAPERGPAGGERTAERLVVHPSDHQHLAAVVLLDHRGHEALVVALEKHGDVGRERVGVAGADGGHRSSIPGRWEDCCATKDA